MGAQGHDVIGYLPRPIKLKCKVLSSNGSWMQFSYVF